LSKVLPSGSDPVNTTDDHLRTIKRTLLQSFPGLANAIVFGTTGGAGDAYTLSVTDAPSSYLDWELVIVKWNVTNTVTAPTLDINGLGTKTIVRSDNSTLQVGDLMANGVDILIYESAQDTFRLIQGASTVKNGGQSGPVTIGTTDTTNLEFLAGGSVRAKIAPTGEFILSPIAPEGAELRLMDSVGSGYGVFDLATSSLFRLFHSADTTRHLEYDYANNRMNLTSQGKRMSLSPDVSTDPYTLDECIKGFWTPTINRDATNPVLTYAFQAGTYQKLGNRVDLHFRVMVSGVTSQGSGQWYIGGIPYVTADVDAVGTIGYSQCFTDIMRALITFDTKLYLISASGINNSATLLGTGLFTGSVTYRVE